MSLGPDAVVLVQGALRAMRELEKALAREGITAEIQRPPGKNPNT